MIKNMLYFVYSVYFFIIIIAIYILFSIPILLVYPFLGEKKHYYYSVFAKYWARTILVLVGLDPKISGRLPQSQSPFIYVFNHQSQLDILIALAFLPAGFLFVAKEELFKIPLLGDSMRRCGYIPIKRNEARKANETLRTLRELIDKGTSILIFPEGTRSLDGQIGLVKRGSIMVAFETQTPLLPVVINPAYRIMPKGSFLLRPARIRLQIGVPLLFDWENRDRAYTQEASAKIQGELNQLLQKIKC
ncbi:MAG: lysophospholipid acyltransferase family protein [Candidatus Margulisiibacteriota bacterium]